ncbi:hypothetical protein MMC26_001605 [Xylographa opegraphella]|nr:hypothetical protein [Xylographa opegraphella]
MPSPDRKYEIILLGATGYTGKYCAEHIVKNLPTDLRWAVAGRSEVKLSTLINELESLNTDRLGPGVEIASLDPEDLDALVKKTKLLITTVGPFHKYGSPVVEACAGNGTHYVDSTGETPWVLEMIRKYHDIAQANRAIMIPQCGLESACSDIMVYLVVSLIRDKLKVGVKDVTATNSVLTSLPSGGTLATVFGIFDHYGIAQLIESSKPYALSPVPGHKDKLASLLTRLSGVRYVPDLGTLTTGLASGANISIVQRSWGLLERGDYYGQNFQYEEYASTRNSFTGFVTHLMITFGMAALAIPPVRWLAKMFVHQPGEGPTKESTAKDRVEFKAIATADTADSERATAICGFNGSAYDFTGVLMAEAAFSIVRDGDKTPASKIGGGVLTPATLGQAYVDRLRNAGVVLEASVLGR